MNENNEQHMKAQSHSDTIDDVATLTVASLSVSCCMLGDTLSYKLKRQRKYTTTAE